MLQARTSLGERVDRWLFDEANPVGDRPPCERCPVADACGLATESGLTDLAVDYLHGLSPDVDAASWAHGVSDETLAMASGVVDLTADEEFPF